MWRKRLRADGGRHCECSQLAGPDLPDRHDHWGEEHLHLACKQVGQRRAPAAIGQNLRRWRLMPLDGDDHNPLMSRNVTPLALAGA